MSQHCDRTEAVWCTRPTSWKHSIECQPITWVMKWDANGTKKKAKCNMHRPQGRDLRKQPQWHVQAPCVVEKKYSISASTCHSERNKRTDQHWHIRRRKWPPDPLWHFVTFFGDENALVSPLSRWQTRPIELTWLHSSFGRAIEAASPSVGRSAPIRGTRMCANDLHRQSDAVRISRHLEPAPPAVPWCRNRVTMDPLYVGRGQWTWAACEQQPAQYHYPVGHQSAEFRAKPQSRDIE